MMDLAATSQAFCEASIRDWTGRAARMLEVTPEIAGFSFATALVLGDVARVQWDIGREPALATRPDDRWERGSGQDRVLVLAGRRAHVENEAGTKVCTRQRTRAKGSGCPGT